MKKFKKPAIILMVCFCLLIVYLLRITYVRTRKFGSPIEIAYECVKTIKNYNLNKKIDKVKRFLTNDEKYLSETDNRWYFKDEDGHIYEEVNKIEESKIQSNIQKLFNFYQYCENQGCKFLYIAAPSKSYNATYKYGIDNFENENFDAMIKCIDDYKIPYLSVTQKAIDEGKQIKDLFFKADGHWTSEAGFWATGKILNELNSRYGFNYDDELTDSENWNYKQKRKFIGYWKQKSDNLDMFVNVPKENFGIYTPKFDTDLTVTNICSGDTRRGTFENSVLFDNRESMFRILYSYYSNGDIRLQSMKNNLNEQGETIYLVRTSFACVVSPFLALQCKELYNADMRVCDFVDGEEIFSAYEFVKENKPDYVLVLYNSVYANRTAWDFNQNG